MEKDKFWGYFDDKSREYVQTIMDAEGDYYDKVEKFIIHCSRGGKQNAGKCIRVAG